MLDQVRFGSVGLKWISMKWESFARCVRVCEEFKRDGEEQKKECGSGVDIL